MANSIKQALDDVRDIAHYSRNLWELLKAILPISWTGGLHILNAADGEAPLAPDKVPAPEAVAAALRKLKNQMKGEIVADDGRVDYQRLPDTDAFQLMQSTSQDLRWLDPTAIEGDDARLAFWINLYNVLTIHGVADLKITRSVMEIPSFFRRVAYQVGPWTFTPDDIENGVLRRGGRHPATKRPAFPKGDPRFATCPTKVDPRIHAALVCASTSCPPVAFYDAERIDQQLDMATANYIAADVHIHEARKVLELPITLLYYGDDFGGPEGIQAFLLKHGHERKEQFEKAFADKYTVSYQRYDWSLNANL